MDVSLSKFEECKALNKWAKKDGNVLDVESFLETMFLHFATKEGV